MSKHSLVSSFVRRQNELAGERLDPTILDRLQNQLPPAMRRVALQICEQSPPKRIEVEIPLDLVTPRQFGKHQRLLMLATPVDWSEWLELDIGRRASEFDLLLFGFDSYGGDDYCMTPGTHMDDMMLVRVSYDGISSSQWSAEEAVELVCESLAAAVARCIVIRSPI